MSTKETFQHNPKKSAEKIDPQLRVDLQREIICILIFRKPANLSSDEFAIELEALVHDTIHKGIPNPNWKKERKEIYKAVGIAAPRKNTTR